MKNAQPFEIRHDGGRMCIFRSIGCIGDSLTSGEFEFDNNGTKGYWDCYDYSWGKYIERETGINTEIFSHGGHTAKHLYIEADRQNSGTPSINNLFSRSNAKQGYIIALGINDMNNINGNTGLYTKGLGNPETDIDLENFDNNADSFTGWYAKVIQRIKTIQPDAKFFLVTCPDDGGADRERFADLIVKIAAKLENCYVLDLYRNAPTYDENFKKIHYCGGHLNALGYLYTSYLFMSYIDWIIKNNPEDFSLVQFIGSGKKKFIEK